MAFCEKCGSQLSNDAAFCGVCGAKQDMRLHIKTCPSCGRNLSTDMIFCNKCGTRYSEKPNITPSLVSNYCTLVLSREEQFFIGDTAIEIYVDDEKMPNNLYKTGNVEKIQLSAGKHLIKLTNPKGIVRTFIARVTEFYIDIQRDEIRISVIWNRVTGKIDVKTDDYLIQYKCHK